MSSIVKLSYYDLIAKLNAEEVYVGNYLGISDQHRRVWTFAIYIGKAL